MDAHPILIVEDNEDDFFILKRAIINSGITAAIHHAADGEEAINYLRGEGVFSDRSRHPLPLLVLLDLKLPKVHGHDVLAWIRKEEAVAGLVVIVLSSSKEPVDITKAYDLGANAYMIKPSALAELVDAVKAVQAFWFCHNIFRPRLPQP